MLRILCTRSSATQKHIYCIQCIAQREDSIANIKHWIHVHYTGIKTEGFFTWVITGIWAAQFFVVWEAPQRQEIQHLWPQITKCPQHPWVNNVTFPPTFPNARQRGGSIPCGDKMITILPVLRPHCKKNSRGKITTFLSGAKFLINLLD